MICAFDPLLVFSSRLGIIACLAREGELSFTELSKLTGLADGNLHVQTRRLAEAGYVIIRKERVARSRTLYRLTDAGESGLRELVQTLELCLAKYPAAGTPRTRATRDDSRVW